ncbi:hypothetical protein H9X90_04870 [Faecalicatena contorta]|uniref:hypothetical protein n=1 Tax=Faecalicatena contorta TaxID=39482 RepID=UPI001961012A|nr:hypothetical protein [Faecalicatena contorta]MBM6686918.1 hypothetical protein [Faecalicatena contorta]MBM6710084.1 hypothetical protein [Faecalicatena contorta]
MAILSTIKKVLPYIKTATGYVLCRLSSQAVEMDDGTTLQESYDSLNSKMTGAFSASDIQSAVVSGVRGGWKRVGDIVFVDVKFNLVASYKDAVIMKNLPVPRNDKAILAAANMSATRSAFGLVGTGGELAWHDSSQPATGNECSITGIYNCV